MDYILLRKYMTKGDASQCTFVCQLCLCEQVVLEEGLLAASPPQPPQAVFPALYSKLPQHLNRIKEKMQTTPKT